MTELRRYKYEHVREDLQRLRHRAYAAANKINPRQQAEDFVDDWDERSTVIIATEGNELAGSVRVIPDVTIPEIQAVHGFGGTVPIPIERRRSLGEGSRLCVDPYARGRGLFWELAAEMVLLARDLEIQNLFGGSTDSLWPNYSECGFSDLGVTYPFSSLNNSLHRLMLMSVPDVIAGKGISSRFHQVLAFRSHVLKRNDQSHEDIETIRSCVFRSYRRQSYGTADQH
jgi:hypothetical protein